MGKSVRMKLAFTVTLALASTLCLHAQGGGGGQSGGGGGSGLPSTATANLCLLSTGVGPGAVWGACSGAGSGTPVSVAGGSALTAANFNATTPAAQSNFINCTFQTSTTNVSLECPTGTTSSTFALGNILNGLTISSTTGTFTLTNAKTFDVTNTLTLSGTDSSTLNIGTGGTLGTGAFATIANYALLSGATFTGAISTTGVTDSGLTSGNCVQASTGGLLTTTSAACGSGSGGLSGMTAGQVPIAATSSTVTSSIALGSTGSDIPQLSSGILAASGINATQTTTATSVIKGAITTIGNTGFLLELAGTPSSPADVATVDVNGNTAFAGTLNVSGSVTFSGSTNSFPNGPISSGSTTITGAECPSTVTGALCMAAGTTFLANYVPTAGGGAIGLDSTSGKYYVGLGTASPVVSAMNYAVTNTTTFPFQSITTTGTSGAATLSGGVLNIPQYSSSGLSGMTAGQIPVAATSSTVTSSIALTNTTDFPFQSLTTTGTSGAATLSAGVLNIPQYSGGGGGGSLLTGTTGSIGGSPLTASCATGTATVTGATTAMPFVASSTTSGAPGAFSVQAQVLSSNTVTVSVCGTGTPTATTYEVAGGGGIAVSGNTTTVASATSGVATAAAGTVLAADGSGNAEPAPAQTTAGLGGIFSNGYPLSITWLTNNTGTVGTTLTYVQQFQVWNPLGQVVGHVRARTVAAGTSATFVACIYSAGTSSSTHNGSLLWSSSASANAANTVLSLSATAVTLLPGVYYIAYGETGTTAATMSVYSGGSLNISDLYNGAAPRQATAANTISGSSCPSNLGALTAASGAVQVIMTLEP